MFTLFTQRRAFPQSVKLTVKAVDIQKLFQELENTIKTSQTLALFEQNN